MTEFRRKFIEMAAPLEKIPENILMGHFVNGLKEDIKAEVRMLGLYNLEQAMDLALKVEEKNRLQVYKMGEGKTQNSVSSRTNSFNTFSTFSRTSSPYSPNTQGNTSSKTLSWGPNSEAGSTTSSLWSQSNASSPNSQSSSPNSQTSSRVQSNSIPTATSIGTVR